VMNEPYLAEPFRLSIKDMVGDLYELYVFINGEFVKGKEAKVSVWDHGLVYGDGVFEGIRAYSGGVFKLGEHLRRLSDSAKAIGIDVPLSAQEIRDVVLEAMRRNDLSDAHIRVIVTRGIGRLGLDPRNCKRASVVVMTYPFPPLLGAKPVRVLSSSIRRKAPNSVDARIKSLNYLDNILAKFQAVAAGYDDAIMLDVNGCIAEATGENVFAIKNEVISTPSLTAALPGITRATVIELAMGMGYPVNERPMTLGELFMADEVFLTGTAAEIAPVAEVDGRTISRGAVGPITGKIIAAYKACVTAEEHLTLINPGK